MPIHDDKTISILCVQRACCVALKEGFYVVSISKPLTWGGSFLLLILHHNPTNTPRLASHIFGRLKMSWTEHMKKTQERQTRATESLALIIPSGAGR